MTTEERQALEALMQLSPDAGGSEAELAYVAFRLGLWSLAAQSPVGIGDAPAYAGFDPAALAAWLRTRLMPVLDFLAQQGQLPLMLTAAAPAPPIIAVPSSSGPEIDPQAAEALEGLGIDLI